MEFPIIIQHLYWFETSNRMLGREIWYMLPKCIFESFEIARVKLGQFQNLKKSPEWSIPKVARTKHVVSYWLIKSNQQTLCIETNIF